MRKFFLNLTLRQYNYFKKESEEKDIAIAELIRRVLDDFLDNLNKKKESL